jgi:hypothetical protein
MQRQVFGAGLAAAGRFEVAVEAGLAIDLEEKIGRVDPGQVAGDLLPESSARPERLLGREWREHEPAPFDSHRVVPRPVAMESGQFLLQFGPTRLQPGRPFLGEPEQAADVPAFLGPPLS